MIAHSHLGEAYLKIKHYDMAIDHLLTALKINSSIFRKMIETRDYHVNILTKLGQCYLEGGQIKEAHDLLNKSLQFSETL